MFQTLFKRDMAHFGSHEFAFDETIFQRVSICQLNQTLRFPVVYGVVIGKSSPRNVPTKKGIRSVLNFTIRDSPIDAINASCWSTEEQLNAISSTFAIGDVVEVKNPQIMERTKFSGNQKFSPHATSGYTLVVNVRESKITVCSGDIADEFGSFIHCPVYTSTNYLSLAEIVLSSRTSDGIFANILVALKHVGPLEVLTTKNGDHRNKLELVVFDESCLSFPIVIWDKEIAMFILKRIALRNVLLISDIRLNFNQFTKKMMATAVSCTVFTPNPDISNARVLYQHAQTVSFEEVASGTQSGNESKIYTAHDVLRLMYQCQLSPFIDTGGVIFAFLSHFDMDGVSKVTSVRCPQCKQFVKPTNPRCMNKNCTIGVSTEVKPPEEVFDLFVNISDHTGTLKRCLMYNKDLQCLLNVTAAEFKNMSDDKKTELKWQYLLEKHKISFKILQSSSVLGEPTICITSCAKADPQEVTSHLEHLF